MSMLFKVSWNLDYIFKLINFCVQKTRYLTTFEESVLNCIHNLIYCIPTKTSIDLKITLHQYEPSYLVGVTPIFSS